MRVDGPVRVADLRGLVSAIRSGTDGRSTMLLAKLRLSVSIEDLVLSVRLDQEVWSAAACDYRQRDEASSRLAYRPARCSRRDGHPTARNPSMPPTGFSQLLDAGQVLA